MQNQRQKKRLTEEEYQAAIAGMNITDQTKDISKGVLVFGRKQADYVQEYGITKAAVSLACRRVWDSHVKLNHPGTPPGFEEVNVVLPRQKAYIVKQWAKDVEQKP